MHKAYELRQYHNQIAPPFNKFVTKRAAELEDLHDDINAKQLHGTFYRFIAWVVFTGFLIDYETMDRPMRHPLVEDRGNGPTIRTRMTFMQDDA
mmetsp:Transcript_16630/g.29926  ORF Transcript_16630/g.29926 Transcript_16630/m.29926 type:complete len:94 (-) Transcript_16630:861-1142(-)